MGGKFVDVAQIDPLADSMIGDWLTLPEAADRLGLTISRVRQLFRDRKLLAVQRPDGTLCVPAAFFDGHQVIRGLHGTLTLLFDCGFDEADALRWLFTADESLPGTPISALWRRPGCDAGCMHVRTSVFTISVPVATMAVERHGC